MHGRPGRDLFAPENVLILRDQRLLPFEGAARPPEEKKATAKGRHLNKEGAEVDLQTSPKGTLLLQRNS